MIVGVQMGAEVELATKGDVIDGFDGVADRVIGALPKRKRKPLLRRIPSSGAVPTVGVLVLPFGNVPAGYTYEYTHCVVVGADASTVLAGASAALYIGNTSIFGLGNIVQPGIAVPGFWNFGGGVIYGHFGDEIFVVVSGAAAGANVSAVLTVLQHAEDTVEAGGI